MATETSTPSSTNVTLGPDWLRDKPVAVFGKIRKNQYDQEELINMWSVSSPCPQTINNIPDLGSSQALKPAIISADDQEQFYRGSMSSDRGRGRPLARGRGGAGVGRGGTRRQFDVNSRYYEQRSTADSDNWRRRDPDPDNHQPDQMAEPQSFIPEQPPSYPPFPSKTLSPTQIDNREANSWKRTEPEPVNLSPAKPLDMFTVDHPPSSETPESMLRNISQTLEPYNSHVMFPGFSEPKAGPGMFGTSSPMDIPASFASQLSSSSTSVASPTIPLDMPPLFNRDTVSPKSVPAFPSLAEIGKSLNEHVPEVRSQGFLPPPPPPPLPYRAADQWYYLDPKGNTQGPFDSEKMLGWFKEGYFGMELEIKRSSDHMFTKLHVMIQKWGTVPFGIEDKQSPPPGNLATSQMMTSQAMTSPAMTRPSAVPQAWTGNNNGIWGTTDHSANFGFPTDSDKAKRAEEMRKEIERAMEQQRQHEREEERLRLAKSETNEFLAAHRHLMEANLVEEQQKAKDDELRRLKDEEMKKAKARLIEEESEKIRIEKERLELERKRQAEKVRIDLEEAEKARKALEQERIKLEKERQMVKRKEEELRLRDEAEKRKQEVAAQLQEERRLAQQAAAEAKALAKAQEEARKKHLAEERARKEEQARRREQENVWGSRVAQSPPAQENTNPWANIPQQNVTKSAPRTSVPTTKGWGKVDTSPTSIPLSQIQQDEVKMKKSAHGSGPAKAPSGDTPAQRQSGWGNAPRGAPSKTRSLAEIQREEEKRSNQQNKLNYAQQNSWNPVAGMLEEETRPVPKKQTKPEPAPAKQPPKQQQQQPSKSNKKGKSQQPLLEMFTTSSPKDDFTVWCEGQVSAFKNQHIDVPTFISFLRDVESPREVREYVVSYLGDTLSTDKFIQEFIARRKTANQGPGSAIQLTMSSPQKDNNPAPMTTSKRGKRKKMQKVNAASLLGINCTASSDARNRGDIDSVATQ